MAARIPKANPLPRTFYNVDEVAESMGLGRDAVYAAMDRGDIPEQRIGGRRLIPAPAFDRWVSSLNQSQPA